MHTDQRFLGFPARAWALSGLMASAVGAVMIARGLSLDLRALPSVLVMLAMFAGGGALLGRRDDLRPLADVLHGLVFLVFAALVVCVGVQAFATLSMPLIDPLLVRADELIGFDQLAFLRFLGLHEWAARPIGATYWLSGLAAALGVLFAAFHDRGRAFPGLVVTGVVVLYGAVAISAVFPAVGAFAHYGIDKAQFPYLSAAAGDYHLVAFEQLRSGATRVLSLDKGEPIVTFPSFHTALALISVWAFRSVLWLWAPSAAFSALVIVSTLTEGGHYLVDLFGGAALFWFAVRVTPWFLRSGDPVGQLETSPSPA
jgi:membrane-associated phospholipid phosphatase